MSDQISYRGNLTTGYLPFLVKLQGQTVIVPKQDQNITPRDQILAGETAADRDRGFPQVLYMHNVLPTNTGFKSVGYEDKLEGIDDTNFTDVFVLRDENENTVLYSPVSGKHYVFDGTVGFWQSASSLVISSSGHVSIAYLNGQTFIYFPKIGLYQYDTVTKLLIHVTPIGLVESEIEGICASNGFLIAWSDFYVFRSNPLSILDFTPDASTGAGSSIPNDIKGQIVSCLPISGGFIIYTTKNAVAASFQNNVQYPFQYREVVGSGGLLSPTAATWQANLGNQYCWTENGLVTINKLSTVQVYPEVTDFLTALLYETYDTTLNQLIVTQLTSPLSVKLALVSERYFAISYGQNPQVFTDALIYDLAYKRWGKLKIDHTCIFEYVQPNHYGITLWNDLSTTSWAELGNNSWDDFNGATPTSELPNTTLAVLQSDGTVKIVSLDLIPHDDPGVILLGKYQFLRDRWLVLDTVGVQNSHPTTFEVYDLVTYNGVTFQPAQQLFPDPESDDNYSNFYASTEGLNHTLALVGIFDLCDFELVFHLGGHS